MTLNWRTQDDEPEPGMEFIALARDAGMDKLEAHHLVNNPDYGGICTLDLEEWRYYDWTDVEYWIPLDELTATLPGGE